MRSQLRLQAPLDRSTLRIVRKMGGMELEVITSRLRRDYGLPVQLVRPLTGGADPDATTFRADGGYGPVVVKLQSVAAAELAVQVADFLAPLGRREFLSPLRTRGGAPYGLIENRALVVWPLRAGRTGFEEHHPPRVLGRVGQLIRAVHDLPVPSDLGKTMPRDTGDDRWRAGTLELLDHSPESADDAISVRFAQLLQRQGHRLRGLVAAASDLAPELGGTEQQVLCHGDLHAGNVLVGPDGDLTVIDWDTAQLARRERDLMFAGAGIVSTWAAPTQIDAFRTGYAGADPYPVDEAAIAYYRCDRICEDFVLNARAIADPRSPDRLSNVATLEGQFQPGDVVDCAERSLGLG